MCSALNRADLTCRTCGAIFDAKGRGRLPKFCSSACRDKSLEKRTKRAEADKRYAKTPKGAEVRRRAQQLFHAKGELPDYIVANRLKMKLGETPKALIELKREQLSLKRLSRELKQAIKKGKS